MQLFQCTSQGQQNSIHHQKEKPCISRVYLTNSAIGGFYFLAINVLQRPKKDKIANQKRRLKAMALRAAISRGKFHLYEENSSTDWPTIDRQVTEQTIYYLQPPAKPPTRQTFCVISLSWALAKISN